jgi:hypothetical protein
MIGSNFIDFSDLASTMRALSSAQQSIVDETNSDWSENDETLSVGGDRYQIVNSSLPINGDYQIAKRMCLIFFSKKLKIIFSIFR